MTTSTTDPDSSTVAGDANTNLGTVSSLKDQKETDIPGLDMNHPTAHLTKQNGENSWFIRRFPQEIQNMILKFATDDAMVIWPTQITSRSNKFVWNEDPKVFPWGYRLYPEKRLKSTKDPMMFTKLLLTCKHFSRSLSERDFYGLHSFAFHQQWELHNFLAAITPVRRKAIRNITLHVHTPIAWISEGHSILDNHMHAEEDLDLLALLCQCSLETFDVMIDGGNSSHTSTAHRTNDLLQKLDNLELPADAKVHSIWSLSGTRLSMTYDDRHTIPMYVDPWTTEENFSLGNLDVVIPWLRRETIYTTIKSVTWKLSKYQHRVKELDKKGQGVRSTITPQHLARALHNSDLDFPGELRITQATCSDEYTYAEGPITTRTRSRTEAIANGVTNWGTVNESGFVSNESWFIFSVTDLRWADNGLSGIEAKRENHCQLINIKTRTKWEDVENVGSWEDFVRLTYYFDAEYQWKSVRKLSLPDARQRLKKLEEEPSPLDIQGPLLPLVEYDIKTNHKVKKKCLEQKFRAYEIKYQRSLTSLRKHITKQEAKEAREARKSAREAAAAAAAATTTDAQEGNRGEGGGAPSSAASGDN